MKATAELQIIPVGSGVSVREEISRVVSLLDNYAFIVQTHASGTNIEGEMEDILDAVRSIHKALHDTGTVRIVSYLKLETRTDKTPTLAGKQLRHP